MAFQAHLVDASWMDEDAFHRAVLNLEVSSCVKRPSWEGLQNSDRSNSPASFRTCPVEVGHTSWADHALNYGTLHI